MSISVVVCAYTLDRWDSLVASVKSCAQQSVRPDEIIVVIDHNDELLERSVIEFAEAIVIANRSIKGLSGARNTGVARSTGDVVAFLDDDAFADSQWLERLTAPMADPQIAGAGGWIVPEWESGSAPWFPETFYWILGCSYAGLPLDKATIRNPIGASMAMRRKVFSSVGGFTSGIGRIGKIPLGCEETELCIRYTKSYVDERFVLARSAVVHHRVPASRLTWHYFWTRCWAEGVSKAAVASLVGAQTGLASERRHVMRSLPLEVGQSLRSMTRNPRAGFVRAVLIFAGTALAVGGLIRGRVALRGTPINVQPNELALLVKLLEDEAKRGSPAPQ